MEELLTRARSGVLKCSLIVGFLVFPCALGLASVVDLYEAEVDELIERKRSPDNKPTEEEGHAFDKRWLAIFETELDKVDGEERATILERLIGLTGSTGQYEKSIGFAVEKMALPLPDWERLSLQMHCSTLEWWRTLMSPPGSAEQRVHAEQSKKWSLLALESAEKLGSVVKYSIAVSGLIELGNQVEGFSDEISPVVSRAFSKLLSEFNSLSDQEMKELEELHLGLNTFLAAYAGMDGLNPSEIVARIGLLNTASLALGRPLDETVGVLIEKVYDSGIAVTPEVADALISGLSGDDSIEKNVWMAKSYMAARDYAKALEVLSRALERVPSLTDLSDGTDQDAQSIRETLSILYLREEIFTTLDLTGEVEDNAEIINILNKLRYE